jgi:hypothetical protein
MLAQVVVIGDPPKNEAGKLALTLAAAAAAGASWLLLGAL